jgi:hypothetical protein
MEKLSRETVAKLHAAGYVYASNLPVYDPTEYGSDRTTPPKFTIQANQSELGHEGFCQDYAAIIFPDGQVWLGINGSTVGHYLNVIRPLLAELTIARISSTSLVTRLPARGDIIPTSLLLHRLRHPYECCDVEPVIIPMEESASVA